MAIFPSYPDDNNLPRNEVYPLWQAKNGDIYIGTTEGLSVYRNGKFSAIDVRNKLGDKELGDVLGLNSLAEKDAAREYLTEVSETSSIAGEEVREIAHNFKPYQLERLGLTNTLEYMIKNLKKSAVIEIFYEIKWTDFFRKRMKSFFTGSCRNV